MRQGQWVVMLCALGSAALLSGGPAAASYCTQTTTIAPIGTDAMDVAVNPVTKHAYVTNYVDDTMTVVDLQDGSTVTVPTVQPFAVVVNPVTNRIYVLGGGQPATVTVYDGDTNTLLATIPIILFSGHTGRFLAINTVANRIYVGNTFKYLTVINGANNATTVIDLEPLPVYRGVTGIAVDTSTNRFYVATYPIGTDGTDAKLAVFDGATNAFVGNVPLGDPFSPGEPAANSSTHRIYVPDYGHGSLAVIDATNNTVIGSVPVGQAPRGVAIDESANLIYVPSFADNATTVVDGGTLTSLGTVATPFAYDATVDSDTGTVYAETIPVDENNTVTGPGGLISIQPCTRTTRPQIVSVDQDSSTLGRYAQFGASIGLDKTYENPFDPQEIAVDVTFTSPSGASQTVPAFWYQDFSASGTSFETYTPVGEPGWRVRFAPSEVGTYQYDVRAVDATGAATPVHGSFTVQSSSRKGFVRVDTHDARYLRYDDGEPYLPVGHDAAFEDGNPSLDGTQYYAPLLQSFGRAGENWTRVWMTDFNRSAIEWSTSHWSGLYEGLGRYSLASAWRMDQILQFAEQNGIEVQLVLDNHSQLSTWVGTSWNDNPYNSANGGPVPAADPGAFFTNTAAKALYKQRLRYLVARYGAYGSLLAWELLNEAQFTGTAALNPQNDAGMRADVVVWHAEMAAYLHSIDPYHHLVTSSSSPSTLGDELNALPGIDVAQLHVYATPPALNGQITALQAADEKPVIAAEFGLAGNPENGFDPTTFSGSQADREHLLEGTHLHNAVWEAALAGSGAGIWWWGTYVDADAAKHRPSPAFPLNEHVFPSLVGYLAGEDWAPLDLAPANLTTSPAVAAVGLANRTTSRLWVHDRLNEYGTGARPGDLAARTITGATVTLNGVDDGVYAVEVWDTYGAGRTATLTGTALGGSMTVGLPAFTRDVALKLTRSGPLPDADGDGVSDAIDVGVGAFNDHAGTTGSIVDRGGNTVTVTDGAAPDGVQVRVTGAGSTPAVISACGFSTIQLAPGSLVTLTCGSVILWVQQGSASVVVGGGITTVTVPVGDTTEVSDLGSGRFGVTNRTGTAPVTVVTNGVTTKVGPGATTSLPVVTIGNVCTLAKLDVQGSAKYRALTAKQRQAVDALATAACATLQVITPKLTAKQKAAQIALFQAAVQALVQPGWLTQAQATALKQLAAQL